MRKVKLFVASLLSFCMVVAGSLPVFAAEFPQQQIQESNTIEIAEEQMSQFSIRVRVWGDGVRLRKEPGLDGTVVGLLYGSNDDWVILTGYTQTVDGLLWQQVVSSSIGKTGWIADTYLEK